ncbi:DUF1302 family protein [Bradyrhizobium sp. NAS96.2]|uniref:DUF1302 domain-containing protein n=1 Tax=Bradyrhizobium sp. NAS96.2 TaxID=1680160 RepID=UPI000939814A|nr:DUF1302 family protein [Bradyrhizobium sp. NAS96.2]OKO80881.1 hypothetical protein AC628_08145 [Bradyrhizobium sp. NAS96.2]
MRGDAKRGFLIHSALVFGFVLWHGQARAEQFNIGEIDVTTHGALTFGQSYRTDDRNPTLTTTLSNSNAGKPNNVPPGSRGGSDGDLNYAKGDPVSSQLKGILSADFNYANRFGVFVEAKAWTDFTQMYAPALFGNGPNGYKPGAPLSDLGFDALAKFSGANFQEAYGYANFDLAGLPSLVKAGYQIIPWGQRSAIPGGLASSVNAYNFADFHRTTIGLESAEVPAPTAFRPDFIPNTATIASPALFLKTNVTPDLRLEGFWQAEFVHSVIDPCGTFFSTSNFIAPGCNFATIGSGPGNSAGLIAAGKYFARIPMPDPADHGQFGVGAGYTITPIATDVSLYYTKTDWRQPVASGFASKLDPLTNKTLFVPLSVNPGAAATNPVYYDEYVKGIDTLAFDWKTNARATGTTFFGEETFRFNQPVSYNLSDITVLEVNSWKTPGILATNTVMPGMFDKFRNIGPGGYVSGYEQFKTLQSDVGVLQRFKNVLGADTATFIAQSSLKHVFDLPGLDYLRFGRSETYGQAAINGVCSNKMPVGCANNGFVTPDAWGVAARFALLYKNIWGSDFDLTPSITYRADLKGWSYDGAINQGRNQAILDLRLDYKKTLYIELSYSPVWGGDYNTLIDRSIASFAIGAVF